MINSVNTLDIIKPKLLNMDKFEAASSTRLHHHHHAAAAIQQHTSPTRAYLTFVTKSAASNIEAGSKSQPITLMGQQQQQQQQPPQRQERVKVQHLENHTKLQNNNCWNNFRTLYNLSASSTTTNPVESRKVSEVLEANDDDMPQQQQPKDDIQNKSALNTIEFNKRINTCRNSCKNISNNGAADQTETDTDGSNKNTNTNLYAKKQEKVFVDRKQPLLTSIALSLGSASHRRTEDQEHAYRRIESVHNYAKQKSYDDEDEEQSPIGSRQSSYEDDEEEEDDGDDDDDNGDNDNDDGEDYDPAEDEMIDLEEDYEDILSRRRFAKMPTSTANNNGPKRTWTAKDVIKSQYFAVRSHQAAAQIHKQQQEDEIDVETVEHPVSNVIGTEMNNNVDGGGHGGGVDGESSVVKPDHHARRPMNAFLIFCKRHRAIVKERYKTLENRAITKILGDWWASLDANDKQSFTNLAQQNKDAFFSANPNFKWYKLPAPPLRTLSTRPTNSGCPNGGLVEYDDFNNKISGGDCEQIMSNNITHSGNNNFFKLADEAQMGDLSQLMQDKSRNKQCALQQALGETSQFMSTHLMENLDAEKECKTGGGQLKRQLFSENSFSSNSSEEDGLAPKKKSARSCKGKIYQELINSGQITAPAVKKSKSLQRLATMEGNHHDPCNDMDLRHKLGNNEEQTTNSISYSSTWGIKRERHFTSESENMYSSDFATFDLEEKIKELPALCLDNYLQRKRNIKKKKKFSSNGKRKGGGGARNSNSSLSSSSTTHQNKNAPLTEKMPLQEMRMQQQQQRKKQQQQQAVVGSQKRKARKESITRRDVSAIEQEVASLLPLTLNGCYYLQEATVSLSPTLNNNNNNNNNKNNNGITYNNDIVQKDPNVIQIYRQTSPIIPMITTTTSITSPLSMSSISTASPTSASPSSPTSPPLQQSTATTPSATASVKMLNETLNDNISSSTSDLLILAEVAANRTEFKH